MASSFRYFANRDQVGQHPLTCLKAPCSRSNHHHQGLGISLDSNGIEQPFDTSQWIPEEGLEARHALLSGWGRSVVCGFS